MGRKGGAAAIQVEGGPQLRRAFKKAGQRADDLSAANGRAAEIVERAAEGLVPFVTGLLRDTIRTARNARSSSVLAGGKSGVPYAGPIHFGWRARNIEPQPFLYDALDERRSEVAATYAAEAATIVRRFDAEAPDLR